MAITITPVDATGPFARSWDITTTLDDEMEVLIDSTALVGLTDANAHVTLTPLSAAGTLGGWRLTNIPGGEISIERDPAVGAGSPAPQIRLTVWRFHSIND